MMPVIISASRPLYLPASKLKEMEFEESESSTTDFANNSPQNDGKVKDTTEKISHSELKNSKKSPFFKSTKSTFLTF